MNLRPPVRRAVSIAAAAFAGAAATLFFASPAAAHHSLTSGTAVCNPDGQGWIVNWVVSSSNNKQEYRIVSAVAKEGDTAVGEAMTGELGSLPTDFKPIADDFTGTQVFPNSVNSVRLFVGTEWRNNDGSGLTTQASTAVEQAQLVHKPDGGCNQPRIETSSSCDEFTITVINPANAPGGYSPIRLTPSVGDGQTIDHLGVGESKDVTFPASPGLKVTVDFVGEFWKWDVEWSTDEDCTPPPAAPAEPRAEFTDNCDETVTVKLFNQSDGGDVTYKVTGSPDVTLIPGETKSVTVPGDKEIVVSHGNWEATHTWQDPGDCLPVTGSSLGGLIAAGAGLLAVGAALVTLFVVLRRRRIRLSV